MGDNADFEALRTRRNAMFEAWVDESCAKYGWDKAQMHSSHDPNACYCGCPEGPCEHDWQGWREFENGSGGERVCARCGMGAMAHSLRVGP